MFVGFIWGLAASWCSVCNHQMNRMNSDIAFAIMTAPIDTIVLLLLLLTFVIVWLSSRECWVGGEPWNDRGDHQLPQGATFVSADVAEVPQEPERDPWRTPVQWTVCFQCFCDSLALFLDIYSHSLGGCGNGLACPVGCMCVCLCMCDVCLMC